SLNIGADGRWLDPDSLRRRFAGLRDADEIVVYCGSGVTACANLLALRLAGLEQARLYPGSWSEWCSYPEHPVARG
ncbi:MAG TPA: rhodanese-like domain-containing protein, partial [Bacillota bacterium]